MSREKQTKRGQSEQKTSRRFYTFIITLMMLAYPLSENAQTPTPASSSILYGTQDPRMIAEIGVDEELWVVTLVRQPSLYMASSEIPKRLTLIVRTAKSERIPKSFLSFPEGTELKLRKGPGWILMIGKNTKIPDYVGPLPDGSMLELPLTRRTNGDYETVYFLDNIKERVPYRTGPNSQQPY